MNLTRQVLPAAATVAAASPLPRSFVAQMLREDAAAGSTRGSLLYDQLPRDGSPGVAEVAEPAPAERFGWHELAAALMMLAALAEIAVTLWVLAR